MLVAHCSSAQGASVGYSVAYAWWSTGRVQRSSVVVGCSVAQLVVRWPAVWQARVQILDQCLGEVCPTEQTSNEETKRGFNERDG